MTAKAQPGHFPRASFFRKKLGWDTTPEDAYKKWQQGKCAHATCFTKEQSELLTAVKSNTRVALKGTHSLGKTEIITFLASWWLARKKHNMVLICSAKEAQTLRVLMPRIQRNWCKVFPQKEQQGNVLGTIIQPNPALNKEWMVLAISGKKTESWQGYHASQGGETLLIIDEGSAMSKELAFAAEGLISGGGARLLTVGNALCEEPQAPFRLAFGDPTFKAITWNPYDHPNLQRRYRDGCPVCRMPIYSNAISFQWVKEQEKKYGIHSKTFKMRVLAQFPQPVKRGQRWILDPHRVADAAGMEFSQIEDEDQEQSIEEYQGVTRFELAEEGYTSEQIAAIMEMKQ